MNHDIKIKLKEHKATVIAKLLFCCAIYSMLMVHNLVNKQDGMWNGTYFFGGNWELSLGRWAIRYIDKLHFGIASNPWNAILTLLLFVIGTEIFVSIFKIPKRTWKDYVVSFLFLSNMVICISLSYPYTSLTYGLAFLLSMLCVKCIIMAVERKHDHNGKGKSNFIYIIVSILSLIVLMGLYQAYVGCITVTMLGYLLLLLYNNEKLEVIGKFFGYCVITAITGFICYELVLHLELERYGVAMSSYNGANAISLRGIIANIIPALKRSYVIFYKYFIGQFYYWNMYSTSILTIVGCIIAFVLLFVGMTFVLKKNKQYGLPYMILFILIPIATNIVFFLAPNSSFLEQQTAPHALVIPVLIALLMHLQGEVKGKKGYFFNSMIAFIVVIILWGNIYQVQVEQEAMREGTIATETMANNVLNTLLEKELYQQDKPIAIIGAPNKNSLFKVTELYNKANGYAKVGGPYWQATQDMWTWRGVFYHRLGVNIPFKEDISGLLQMQEVKEMPIYPQDGSIKEIDGTIVVKISD